jgi:AhpD family alkylhydroperoxidase
MKLDERMMRLIAIGASVSANCQGCLQSNVTAAQACGASEEEIREAILVGRKVRAGAASKMDTFASSLQPDSAKAEGSGNGGCRCGS